MDKIQFHRSKALKLTNVLKYKALLDGESFNFNVAVEQMNAYIRSKGAMQIGPLIQYTRASFNADGKLDMDIVLMLQCSNYIHNVQEPYSMDSLIRISNAMYCRYHGPEDKLKFAYDKINLEAFENDESLSDENYTIFVSSNGEEETITADVFIPRKKGSL